MEDKCIMYRMGECSGYNFRKCIGLNVCKYGRTRDEQKEIENRLVEDINKRMPYLYHDVQSLAEPGRILIVANEHNNKKFGIW